MRKNCPPHSHKIQLPSGRIIRTKTDCYADNFVYDEELGILPALAALAPAAIGIAGDLLGGGKKKGRAAPSGGVDTSSILQAIQSADRGANTAEVESIVRKLLGQVPPPVREQVADALREYKMQNSDIKETMKRIVDDIGKKTDPALNAAIEMLKQAQLQRNVTDEHRVIVKNDNRWKANTENQRKILQRLDLLEKRIGGEIRGRRNLTTRAAAAFAIPTKIV